MLAAMAEDNASTTSEGVPPDFSGVPSRPRAGRLLRVLVYLLLLAFACAAIWFIDRGAMLTNTHP
jgi:hypothetical protein